MKLLQWQEFLHYNCGHIISGTDASLPVFVLPSSCGPPFKVQTWSRMVLKQWASDNSVGESDEILALCCQLLSAYNDGTLHCHAIWSSRRRGLLFNPSNDKNKKTLWYFIWSGTVNSFMRLDHASLVTSCFVLKSHNFQWTDELYVIHLIEAHITIQPIHYSLKIVVGALGL